MHTQYLDLWVHDDRELESLLGESVLSREKLHHWPLSYVEKITFNHREPLIYKSQNASCSVERIFYSQMKAPFLLEPVWSGVYENCDLLLLPYVDCLRMDQLSLDAAKQASMVAQLNERIQILPNMPVFFDLSSMEKLLFLEAEAVQILKRNGASAHALNLLDKWTASQAPACYRDSSTGNVHGDLSGQNVLIGPGGLLYILDWQRPLRAPKCLENALAKRLSGIKAHLPFDPFWGMALICEIIWYSFAYEKWLTADGVLEHAKDAVRDFENYVGSTS